MRRFLQANSNSPLAREDNVRRAATAAYTAMADAAETAEVISPDAASREVLEDADLRLAPLETCLTTSVVAELGDLWTAIVEASEEDSGKEGGGDAESASAALGTADIEELVLAHLCEYPPFLAEALLDEPLRRLNVGQGLAVPGAGSFDIPEVRKRLAPQLPRHRDTAARIASEACSHCLQRSEKLAGKVLARLDLNKDGVVTRDEFLKAAPHALALEVENVALSVGMEALLGDPEFADDFHTAMASTMGIIS